MGPPSGTIPPPVGGGGRASAAGAGKNLAIFSWAPKAEGAGKFSTLGLRTRPTAAGPLPKGSKKISALHHCCLVCFICSRAR